MKTYNLPTLSPKTSKEEQAKLVAALESVQGVQKAILHTDRNSFEIEPKPKQQPKHAELMSAASKAGFAAKAN